MSIHGPRSTVNGPRAQKRAGRRGALGRLTSDLGPWAETRRARGLAAGFEVEGARVAVRGPRSAGSVGRGLEPGATVFCAWLSDLGLWGGLRPPQRPDSL